MLVGLGIGEWTTKGFFSWLATDYISNTEQKLTSWTEK